jgi:hypothetical protein
MLKKKTRVENLLWHCQLIHFSWAGPGTNIKEIPHILRRCVAEVKRGRRMKEGGRGRKVGGFEASCFMYQVKGLTRQ